MTTTERIEQLRAEAMQAGDREQVALCDRALAGDVEARAECVRVMAETATQIPTDDALSDAVARVMDAYRMHFSSSAICDEIHAAIVRELVTLMLPPSPGR